jgi:muramoyltetrapeptide carboxypeptidase
MHAKRISPGDTIGLFCPSHVADPARYAPILATLKRLGYRVSLSENFYGDAFGYAGSAAERAADFNALIADDDIRMILFGGGYTAAEILPHIDYENIRRHPKPMNSFSDATSILNAVYARTGLITYYGSGSGEFADLRQYNYQHFLSHHAVGYEAPRFEPDSAWKTLCGGCAEGILMGGYLSLFALLLNTPYFPPDKNKKVLLFIEDHERYSQVGAVATYLSLMEQSPLMENVTGLFVGHYAENPPQIFFDMLQRMGERNHIPVVYTDDFGHGTRHGILPIGARARLDADAQALFFLEG